ncbi:MAG: UDP-N-acetylmuramate--L-alanine ligase [Oscillospiraceae bacterium]|jgi:UDP-N-acetylmuramate--alanine ligase|nr:UDP-N-acetylmuramate--L-alanine ligase [Oscillospiraceae bacterium]
MSISELEALVKPGKRCHLIGIGGVSMSPLAEVLLAKGVTVTGSDISESAAVAHLRELGVTVYIGHSPENVGSAEFVIRTAAAGEDNPEVAECRRRDIPLFERAQGWGLLMRGAKNAVCIAGAHGKTTTTSMVAAILIDAQADPTVMIGGTLPKLGSGYRVGDENSGKSGTYVLESCEYKDSFLYFYPTVAVVLNVDADHLDYFKNLDNVKTSFRRFAELTPEDTGIVVSNADDGNTVDTLAGISRRHITFGIENPADFTAKNIRYTGTGSEFEVFHGEARLFSATLREPGLHNVQNALAAAAVTSALGVAPEQIQASLAQFMGAERRFEYKGEINGAKIYDDYAHHPTELKMLLDAAEKISAGRIIVAFQPHTYTRTHAHFDAFVEQLRRPDKVFLADIYAARELNEVGVSSKDLAEKIPGAVFEPDFDRLAELIAAEAAPGDIVLTVGAGELYKVGEALSGM